jgi:hypothetical protein
MSLRGLYGLCGAVAGALLPVAFAVAAPPHRTCCQGLHGANWAPGRQPVLYIDWIWTPEIDRDVDPPILARTCRTTPEAAARLTQAPLPRGFDPRDVPPESLYACILVAPDGGVEAVRLIGGTGSAAVDAALARAIEDEWRFEWTGGAAQWVRVRLDAPADSQLSVPPAPILV